MGNHWGLGNAWLRLVICAPTVGSDAAEALPAGWVWVMCRERDSLESVPTCTRYSNSTCTHVCTTGTSGAE
ncbi:hypothetical protein DFP73DRAFT_545661 [Morchella snyderi]|nr:hypothetical protein DFP73DRAFT_545661 [Morchella snyderi]